MPSLACLVVTRATGFAVDAEMLVAEVEAVFAEAGAGGAALELLLLLEPQPVRADAKASEATARTLELFTVFPRRLKGQITAKDALGVGSFPFRRDFFCGPDSESRPRSRLRSRNRASGAACGRPVRRPRLVRQRPASN